MPFVATATRWDAYPELRTRIRSSRSIVRRAATLTVELEQLEAKFADGQGRAGRSISRTGGNGIL